MENTDTKNQESKQDNPKYWLSLEQWRNDPEFKKLAENEFLSSPLGEKEDGWARREFLKLMTASVALTSFGCIRRPVQKIVPYANRPEEIIPGLANYYSSSFTLGSEAFGLVVKTREGRPIKVEGNPDFPGNAHGLSARAHGYLLSLYDPDRLTAPKKLLVNDKKTNYDAIEIDYATLDKEVIELLRKGNVGLLTSSIISPSTQAVVDEFQRAFGVKHYSVDGVDYSSIRQAGRKSYGEGALPRYRFDKAKMILSIGSDFLGADVDATENMMLFSKGRNPDQGMNKLVVFESMLSLTGSNADSRMRIKPSERLDVVLGLLNEIIIKQGKSQYAHDSSIQSLLKSYGDVAKTLNVDPELFSEVAKDLWDNRGQSLVVAGYDSVDAVAVQIAVNLLNSALENDGATVDHKKSAHKGFQGSLSNLKDLAKDVNSGQVKTLIIADTNPGYSFGQQSLFRSLIQKVSNAIYVGDRIDETGRSCQYVIPASHNMEEWNDVEPKEGLFLIQQPTIQPLYNSRSLGSTLLQWLKGAGKGSSAVAGANTWYDYLQTVWKNKVYAANRGLARGSFDDFWYELLQKGFFETESSRDSRQRARSFNKAALSEVEKVAFGSKESGDFELEVYRTVGLSDGSLANVSWLQEFPDPVTKICWDNYINVSPKNAEELRLKEGQMARIKWGEAVVEAPIHIQPGIHDNVLAIATGYGRTRAGQVANGVGVDVSALADHNGTHIVGSGHVVEFEPLAHSMELACPQGHHTMEGRQIIVEATLEQYQRNKSANIHKHKIFSLWNKHEYKGIKWSMAIDLSKCTGCSACVVACQSENNIPVVGKKYVIQGRIMQWIRLDRYYSGSPENPDVLFMPVMCQHCDNAPCETVCPVAATVHNNEGLNDMIYNRCVGTRYCANNCPYKVRRFNWFDYTGIKKPLNMAMNPEVSQRARGVMEKCSFCKSRIKSAQMTAKNEGRPLKEGEVKTACQESCPTQAIYFGDINDKNSEVYRQFHKENSYKLLEELNAVPAVAYQTKIRNAHHLKGASGHENEQGQENGGHH